MAGNIDESLMSTASTLVDSCAATLNTTNGDENDHVDVGKENHGGKSLIFRGKIANVVAGRFEFEKGKATIVSPTATAIEISNGSSEATTPSKLEHLRARTKLLRQRSSQKIEESRASLRKTRTLPIESPSPAAHPPPYPPPSVQMRMTGAEIKGDESKYEKDFSDYLRRSNSVIDRLSSEIAMAGSIINDNSSRADRVDNKTIAKRKTNDFASNLFSMYQNNDVGTARRHIRYKPESARKISFDEDWCQSTISASSSPPGSPSSSAPESSEPLLEAYPPRIKNQSGLPPPEVVVKRISPQVSPRSAIRSVDEESLWGTPSTKLAMRTKFEGRQRRQRPPSISSTGDCESMYNTNQKYEKLAMENDCLKRQVELLESRHRDAQQQLLEHLEGGGNQDLQGKQRTGQKAPATSKRKRRNSYHLVILLVLAPFIVFSLSWLYGSDSNATASFSARGGIGQSSIMRDDISSHVPLGETVFSDKSGDTNDEDSPTITDRDDELEHSLVLHEPPIEFREKKEEHSGKVANYIKRIASKMKFREDHNSIGVWLKKHEQITMKKKHAEL